MNLFETVKGAVTVKQAAEYYGLNVGRNGMVCCPFHDDRHPSMKLNEDYFYCFGCGATGDVIGLVSRLFGLSAYEAAQKLAYDFGIDPDKPPAAKQKPKYQMVKAFREDELYCQRVLCDYLHLLEDWKVRYAPISPEGKRVPIETDSFDGKRTSSEMTELSLESGSEGYEACEDVDDRFVEACQMLDYIKYLADILTVVELEQRVTAVDLLMKDGSIVELDKRLNRLKKEEVKPYGKKPEIS